MRRCVVIVLVIASCEDEGKVARAPALAPVPQVDAAIAAEEPPWPIYGDASCDEACRFERYHGAWLRLQAMEVGGMEVMIGEALAGNALLAQAILPRSGRPTVAGCNALEDGPVTVVTEALRQPQRDCYFDCMRKPEPRACARDAACGILPVLDGAWTLSTLSPRLGCLAQIAGPVKPACRDREVMTSLPGHTSACSPRKACRDGAEALDPAIAPYASQPDRPCELRPVAWWCTEVTIEYPRAECQYGRWKD